MERRHGAGVWTPGEVCPTAKAPVLVSDGEGVHPELQTWGYRLPGSLVINARAETAPEKNLFRDSLVSRRCVVPSTGFFEWDREKRKYLFTLPGEPALYMAGLYRMQEGRPCYCVLTTAANDSMKEVHPRMPLVLRRNQVVSWLERPGETEAFLRMTPPLLERTAADAQISLW